MTNLEQDLNSGRLLRSLGRLDYARLNSVGRGHTVEMSASGQSGANPGELGDKTDETVESQEEGLDESLSESEDVESLLEAERAKADALKRKEKNIKLKLELYELREQNRQTEQKNFGTVVEAIQE